MSPVTWWVVCRVHMYEQYRCDVVIDSWFGFSAVMFFVTRFFSNVDIESTRIWWDNIWPKDRILLLCIYEFHGTQKNTAQHCRCSQKSWFKTAQRDRCSFGTWRQYEIDVLYCPFRKSEIFKKDLNHARSLKRFTLNGLIIFICTGKKLLHQ